MSLHVVSFADLGAIPPRPCRGTEPVEYDATPVKVRGEALDPVWWRGRQWAVTEFGLERLDGTYTIEASRLAEHIDVHPWPLHISIKGWADSDDFVTAWLVALALHGVSIPAKKVREAVSRSYPRRHRPPATERSPGWQPPTDDE